ncbi:hypothetical protein LIA77_04089 [Sarocladium implicatum]|nr:hypothetical protein LIA77_04089 [Sarocladium implicatum]
MDGIGVSRAMLETWQSEVCHHDHLPLCSSEEEDLVALLALAQGKDVEGEELCGACVLGLREAVWVVVEEGEGRDGGRFGSFMAVEGQEYQGGAYDPGRVEAGAPGGTSRWLTVDLGKNGARSRGLILPWSEGNVTAGEAGDDHGACLQVPAPACAIAVVRSAWRPVGGADSDSRNYGPACFGGGPYHYIRPQCFVSRLPTRSMRWRDPPHETR